MRRHQSDHRPQPSTSAAQGNQQLVLSLHHACRSRTERTDRRISTLVRRHQQRRPAAVSDILVIAAASSSSSWLSIRGTGLSNRAASPIGTTTGAAGCAQSRPGSTAMLGSTEHTSARLIPLDGLLSKAPVQQQDLDQYLRAVLVTPNACRASLAYVP